LYCDIVGKTLLQSKRRGFQSRRKLVCSRRRQFCL
jgi:hypothetical protein